MPPRTARRPRAPPAPTPSAGPILQVPDDILTEIFRQFHLAINDAPFVLSWVSSRWRRTAINDPVLWSKVKITNLTPDRPITVLSRSGSSIPLKIEFKCDLSMPLIWLKPYTSRIQELSFSGRCEPELPPYIPGQRQSELILRWRPRDEPQTIFPTQTKELPSLRYLKLNQFPLLSPTWTSLPLLQLTRLIISVAAGADVPNRLFPPLYQPTHLQHLEIVIAPSWQDTIFTPASTATDYRPVILPLLRSLNLGVALSTSILLKPLVLPRLERISISRCSRGWLDDIKSLAERSSFHLTHFSMNQCSPPGQRATLTENDWDDQIIQLLKFVPSIEYFHSIDSGALGRPLLDALTSMEGAPHVLGPSLKAFSMINVGSFEYTKISASQLSSAFKSRNHGIDPGVSVDEESNLVVLHHDQNLAEKELKRVRLPFWREEPSFQYARHIVFCS